MIGKTIFENLKAKFKDKGAFRILFVHTRKRCGTVWKLFTAQLE